MPSPRAARSKPGSPTQTNARTPSTPAPAAPPRQQATPPQTQRSASPAPSPGAPPRRKIVTQNERDAAMNLPLVKQIVDLFDARLVDLADEARPAPPVTPPDVDASDTTEEDDDV